MLAIVWDLAANTSCLSFVVDASVVLPTISISYRIKH